jgi:histidinol-phosphatase (PHP family)
MIHIDYHTHHARCGHAHGQIEDYIRAAITLGMDEIGISDHSPIFWMAGNDPLPHIAMAKDELDSYVDEVLRLQAKYAGQIAVRLGLESDYVEGMEAYYAETLARYPFDYVIGSVHHVLGRNVYDARRWEGVSDPLPVYAEYYRLVGQSARSGLFDIIAHATAITAYAPKPIPASIEPLQDAALREVQEAGVALEINTSGYRKMTTDPFPTLRMIEAAHQLGIPLTFSSDAHRPEEVGFARERIAAHCGQIGVTALATFAGRSRIMRPLTLKTLPATLTA